MIIPVDDNMRIRSDSNCWIVERKVGIDKKTGMPRFDDPTYHGNIYSAIKSAYHRSIRAVPDVLDFEEAIKEADKVLEKFQGIYEKIKSKEGK